MSYDKSAGEVWLILKKLESKVDGILVCVKCAVKFGRKGEVCCLLCDVMLILGLCDFRWVKVKVMFDWF